MEQLDESLSRPAGVPLLAEAAVLPTLATERLTIRWLTAADVPALFAIFGDADVCRYWSHPPLADLAAASRLLAEIHAYFAARTLFQWGIARRDGGGVIGTCTLASIDAAHRRAELGFALRRDCWGRGYIAEALPALLAFAFETLGLHRLEADVDPRNEASVRVVERLGFRREGLLRERYHVLGDVQDSLIYGLLRREWAARGAKA
ncbi:MAG TPA: GNAT family N-acetyltransferase [Gemmatimonadaceae bacterium]|nr:GNAT family N-acetyltransferase [Gemmatimonadaceae bacterium]